MRAISLINRLEFDFDGSVVRKGVTLGDVDNDGSYELVVGNETGEVAIFKYLERWQTLTNLGFVSCVVVGDVLNKNKNCLVIVTADGWCYIYYAEQHVTNDDEITDTQGDTEHTRKGSEQVDGQVHSGDSLPRTDSQTEMSKELDKTHFLKRIHAQRIPPNTKDILLGDIDGDGSIEMVLGLTDRVVRSYRWTELQSEDALVKTEPCDKDNNSFSNLSGKLVALNKWECAQQIGSISLHHSLDGVPSLLVAQPGGSYMRICHYQDEASSQPQENDSSRMRNPNISTEILGDLKTIPNLNSSVDSNNSNKSNSNKGDNDEKFNKSEGVPYAVATLDGTIMLLQDDSILWSIAVDHQIFALTKLDVTGSGTDEIVICTWDGHTYILDQQKNIIRFQLDESIQAFDSGYYTLIQGNSPVTCFVYITFRNKILLYFDIPLKNMVCKSFDPDMTKLGNIMNISDEEEKQALLNDANKKKQLVRYLLYGVKFDKLLE